MTPEVNPAEVKVVRLNQKLADAHRKLADAQEEIGRLNRELAVAWIELHSFNADVNLAFQAFNRG